MSEVKTEADDFLEVLEKGVRDILKNRKASKADKLNAIDKGVKIAGIRHKIAGAGEPDEGFFK